jgi:N-acetylmuramic acid 6-phosphate etherase
VVAQDAAGRMVAVGGRGVLLGDEGSGYSIAVAALRAVARARDGLGPATPLETALPEAAGLGDFTDFVAWHPRVGKAEIAALVAPVIAQADAGDPVASACVAEEADALAARVWQCQRRADLAAGVPLYLQGGMFREFPLYRAVFVAALADYGCTLAPCDLAVRGHAAVARLAECAPLPSWARGFTRADCGPADGGASTEAASGPALDTLDTAGILRRMHGEEAAVSRAAGAALPGLAQVADWAAAALRGSGRLIYAGAGTSGRLGVLDASECPPTFGVAPGRVVGLIAGGERALRESVEGAEDDAAQGAADIAGLSAGAADVVVGIAASGTTPYVLGALAEARARGARTVLLACNPAAPVPAGTLGVVLDTGAEVLPGSTRLKAGTATKLALNMITTAAFTRAGHVHRGRMVRMRAVNAKLRARAVRMVAELGGVDTARAAAVLSACDHEIPTALVMLARGLEPSAARAALASVQQDLARALEHPGA